MNEYSIVVDFQNGNIYTDLSILVQNDYNAYKLNFEFDKEFERALFKLKYPVDDKEWVQDIVDNQLTLPVLKDTGDYEYEISIYSEDGRLTGYATEKFHVRSELINTDEIVEPDDRVPVLDNLINETTQLKNETAALKEEVEDAIEETNNLNIDVSDKVNKEVNITLTKKDNTTKRVTLKDGTSLMFNWDGTRLGIKTDEDEEYTYVDLRGIQGPRGPQGEAFKIKKTYATIAEMIADYDNMQINDYVNIKASVEQEDNSKLFTKGETEDPVYRWLYLGDFSGATGIQGPTGATPNIQIGIVTSGTTPSVTRTGTNENPILNFVLEKGEIGPTGPQGETGNGIASITKTSTVDTVDTYTILYTNGTTSTFTVTNGEVSQKQLNVVQTELDKYKTLSKLLPKVEGEGTDITLNNTVEGVTMDITPEGATSQHTTTGKQLFNINDLKSIPSGVTIGDDGYVTLNIVNNGSSNLYVDLPTHNLNLENSTDYLLITEIENISNCALLSCTQWGQITAAVRKDATGTSINTITTKATVSNDIGINTSVGIYANTTGTVKFRLSVYPYSTMTVDDFVYEEYTGGQPSPSLEYPQPIKVVAGEQNVNVSSKNLFIIKDADYVGQSAWGSYGGSTYTKLENGYYFPGRYTAIGFQYDNLEVGENYTIGFDVVSNASASVQVGLNVYQNHTEQNYWKNYTATATIQRITWTFTADVTNRIAFNTGSTADRNFTITNIQLEKGDTATYTPYYNEDYPLSLGTLELAKIGDYQDYIYGTPNNWYKHEIIKKVSITNNTIINKISSTRYNIKDDIDYYFSGENSQPGAISNYYISRYANTNGSILSSSTYNAISVYDDRFESVDDFKTWAIQNLIICRILSTAREIPITDTILIEQLNNLYNATSQDGTTIITCSSASDDNETLQVKASAYKDISAILNPVVESEGE